MSDTPSSSAATAKAWIDDQGFVNVQMKPRGAKAILRATRGQNTVEARALRAVARVLR